MAVSGCCFYPFFSGKGRSGNRTGRGRKNFLSGLNQLMRYRPGLRLSDKNMAITA